MQFRLRSFVRRGGRGTPSQARAQESFAPHFGLSLDQGLLDYAAIFGRQAPCFLEIGFGTGKSFVAAAKDQPSNDFIGVETHRPGIGSVFIAMKAHQLTNIRLFDADVIDVLDRSISDGSLEGIQIFFPDPWPKRRHHARRLIQPHFVRRLVMKLKTGGSLHLATDWEDYARQMMLVLSAESALKNMAGVNQYSDRSPYRPILTKFERRAIQEGREIRDLQFEKV